MRFRKTITVDAWLYGGPDPTPDWIPALWFGVSRDGTGEINIPTRNGVMTAYPGEWIVRASEDEIFSMRQNAFEKEYEPTSEAKRCQGSARNPL